MLLGESHRDPAFLALVLEGEEEGEHKIINTERRMLLLHVSSFVQLFVTPLDCSPLTPLSIGFSRQEYWSGLPFPPPQESS